MTLDARSMIRQTVSAVASAGVGALTLSTAVTDFRALGAGDDGKKFRYTLTEGSDSETGWGTYTHAGTSFARTKIEESTNSNNAITATTAAIFSVAHHGGAEKSALAVERGYKRGCEMIWIGNTSIDCGPGAVHIEGLEAVVEIPSTLSATSISLGNNAWGYAYIYAPNILTTPTLVFSTVAPAAAYAGKSRSASGTIASNAANLHRFVGAVKTNGSGNIHKFGHNSANGLVVWRDGDFTWNRVLDPGALSTGQATTATAASCAVAAPPQSRLALLFIQNNWGSSYAVIATTGDGVTSTSNFQFTVGNGQAVAAPVYLDSSQSFDYFHASGAGGAALGLYVDVMGFYLDT